MGRKLAKGAVAAGPVAPETGPGVPNVRQTRGRRSRMNRIPVESSTRRAGAVTKQPGAIPAITVHALLEGMRAVGLDTQRIVRRCGAFADDLVEARGRVSDLAYEALWREARASSRLDALGPAVGAAVPVGMLGVTDYLASTAATLGESITCTRDFASLTAESSFWEIEKGQAGELRVRFINVVQGEQDEVGDEFVLGLLFRRVALWACRPVPCLEVQLTRRTPSRAIAQWFGGRVSFGHPHAQVVLGSGAAGIPFRAADPYLHETLRALVVEAGRWPQPQLVATQSLRACVRELLSLSEAPTLARAARQLGMSARTLQRRLSDDGTTFERSVDSVRQESALRMLRATPRPQVLQVALRLGFSDERAFSRAFRRWTGLSPRQWQRAPAT